jgi:hypothetical protein
MIIMSALKSNISRLTMKVIRENKVLRKVNIDSVKNVFPNNPRNVLKKKGYFEIKQEINKMYKYFLILF